MCVFSFSQLECVHANVCCNQECSGEQLIKQTHKTLRKNMPFSTNFLCNIFAKIFVSLLASSEQAREQATLVLCTTCFPHYHPKNYNFHLLSFSLHYHVKTIAVLHSLINYEWGSTRKSKLNHFLHVMWETRKENEQKISFVMLSR